MSEIEDFLTRAKELGIDMYQSDKEGGIEDYEKTMKQLDYDETIKDINDHIEKIMFHLGELAGELEIEGDIEIRRHKNNSYEFIMMLDDKNYYKIGSAARFPGDLHGQALLYRILGAKDRIKKDNIRRRLKFDLNKIKDFEKFFCVLCQRGLPRGRDDKTSLWWHTDPDNPDALYPCRTKNIIESSIKAEAKNPNKE